MSQQYNIFYADDDRDDLDLFRCVVGEIDGNYQLHTQRNGEELLHALENPPPSANVVFLDLNMPVKNGYQVLTELRARDKNKFTPIVVFSTSSDISSVNQSRELGANLFITKPESYEQLRLTVEKVLAIDWSTYQPTETGFVFTAN